MTWQQLLQEWSNAVDESGGEDAFGTPQADLAQFAELCTEFGGLRRAFASFSEWELLGERFLPEIDAGTRRLSSGKLLPLVTTSSFAPSGYVESSLPGLFGSLGVERSFNEGGQHPLWFRFHNATGKDHGGIRVIRARFENSDYADDLRTDGGHVWIPLNVDEQLDDLGLIGSLIDECRDLLRIAVGEAR